MRRLFKKENILTIPNLLSLFRLILIPVIIWLYCIRRDYGWTIAAIAVSGLSDVLDGIIARKCSMVSDLGKILDPVADKLTQGAILICLGTRYPLIWTLLLLFACKEIIMILMGCMALRHMDVVNSAKWYGKMNTVVLYVSAALLILFPNMGLIPANGLIWLCCLTTLLSLILYIRFYLLLFRQHKKQPSDQDPA